MNSILQMKQSAKMNKRYLIDTNVLLRLLLQDIPSQYNQAEKLFLDAKNGKTDLIIPQIVIFEINFALKKFYHLKKEDIIEKLKSLVSTDYVQVESRDTFQQTFILYKKNNVSFVDCFLIAKTQVEEAELFTFDHKLKKLK